MEGQVILTTPQQLKLLVIEAVGIALKCSQTTTTITPAYKGDRIDFEGMCEEYYPGIPESTVRQDTAPLGRTKVGKRILFDRAEIEAHLKSKRRPSSKEIDQLADSQFTTKHQRKGGRKAA
ncbi:hypothetical protein [Arsenicibacter rosenii]|uniref:Uncharacterized protein n=1 Tax=Arsenicibacter rosenii TaxID=1750698 RepID=A0A1S2VLL8_9BACT|nr:hypothetical protein [Arsenicibacter rosenii]OIN59096.1 hypothetical protein BLX24_12895 [Arsenicibacter rosenii]